MRLPEALTIPNAENSFFGVPMAQTWSDLALWEEFLNQHGIASLIELGTWKGGMAAYLSAQCHARAICFATIDRDGGWMQARHLVEGNGGSVQIGDVFDFDTMETWLMGFAKPRLLFCDNGDKRRELREFAPLLSPGEFLTVHDWGSESGPEDICANWLPVLGTECEVMASLTRFFQIS